MTSRKTHGRLFAVSAMASVAIISVVAGCSTSHDSSLATESQSASASAPGPDKVFTLAGVGCTSESSANWSTNWAKATPEMVGYPDFSDLHTVFDSFVRWVEIPAKGLVVPSKAVPASVNSQFKAAGPTPDVRARTSTFSGLPDAVAAASKGKVYEYSVAEAIAAASESAGGARIAVGSTNPSSGAGIIDLFFVAIAPSGGVMPIGSCFTTARGLKELPDQAGVLQKIEAHDLSGVIADLHGTWQGKGAGVNSAQLPWASRPADQRNLVDAPPAIAAKLRIGTVALEVPDAWLKLPLLLCTKTSMGWNACINTSDPKLYRDKNKLVHLTAANVPHEDLFVVVQSPNVVLGAPLATLGSIPAALLDPDAQGATHVPVVRFSDGARNATSVDVLRAMASPTAAPMVTVAAEVSPPTSAPSPTTTR